MSYPNRYIQQSLWAWKPGRPPSPTNGFARALEIVLKCGRRVEVAPARAAQVEKTCPKCGHTGEVARDFGVRVTRGVARPQSWCRDCRRHRAAASPMPSYG